MCSSLTAAGLGKFRQSQESVIAGNRLEGDVAVPLSTGALAALIAICVELLSLRRTDNADFVVFDTVLTSRVDYRMNV